MVPINYLAVIVSTFVCMGLGALWYGPLFGRQWETLMKFTPEDMAAAREKGMGKSYAAMGIGALLMSWVLAHAIIFASVYLAFYGALAGAAIGFLNWLGFIAPVTMGTVIWEGKSWRLWAIGSGYYLVTLVIIGMILAIWK